MTWFDRGARLSQQYGRSKKQFTAEQSYEPESASDGSSSGLVAGTFPLARGLSGASRERSATRTGAASVVSRRIVTLDLLRGYFLFIMIVDHLGRLPNLFDLVTGRDQMWASAAEGFFFISGMAVAIVRNRDADTYGFRTAAIKMWKRAGSLYLWSVALTLAFTYIVFGVGEHHAGVKPGVIDPGPFVQILYQAATFQYVYGWTDYLPYYAIFLLAAPLVLWIVRRKLWWVAAIASVAIWASFDRFGNRWQVLFVAGMISGFYLPAAEQWFHHLHKGVRRLLVATLAGLASLTVLLSASFVYLQRPIATLGWWTVDELRHWNDRLAPHFNKALLPMPRLLVFGLWIAALFVVFRRFEIAIRRYLGWFLEPIGRHSLFVYILHGFVVVICSLALPQTGSRSENFAITASCLLLIWGVTVRAARTQRS
jgi:hypothetical protein